MIDDPEQRAISAFRDRFKMEPAVLVNAPGRVNLIGDHVDYTGGSVLPIAIERSTVVALSRSDTTSCGDETVIQALDLGKTIHTDLASKHPPEPSGSPDSFVNYVRGPIEQLRSAGLECPQLSMTIASSIPMGGGLSSSAALEVAVLIGMRALLEHPAEPLEIALEAQEAEHTYAGTPCGIMDMYVSAAAIAGYACLIDCATNELTQIPMPSEDQAIILITDTATRHELSSGAYAERRRDCEEAARLLEVDLLGQASIDDVRNAGLPDALAPRAKHVVEEIQRVHDFSERIQQDDLVAAGKLMFESHESLRTQFEVSIPELDLLVEIARSLSEKGVYGCRMTGGGFGGCTVSLCSPEGVQDLKNAFDKGFSTRFGRNALSFVTRAADGARIIDQTAL